MGGGQAASFDSRLPILSVICLTLSVYFLLVLQNVTLPTVSLSLRRDTVLQSEAE